MFSLAEAAAFACVAVGMSACGPEAPRPAVAMPGVTLERFDARLALSDTGDLTVTEQMEVRVPPGGAVVERDLHAGLHDEITDIEASADGAITRHPQSPWFGRAPDIVRVRWQLTGPASLTLRYRVRGAVAVQGARASLAWPTLPAPFLPVTAARIALEMPADTVVTELPRLPQPQWRLIGAQGPLVIEGTDVPAGDPGTVDVQFVLGPRAFPEPRWQFEHARAKELMPAFASGGAFMLVVALGIVWIVLWQARDVAIDERRQLAAGLRLGGGSATAFGVVCAAVTPWLLGAYGTPPLALPGGIVLGGVILYVVGRFWRP